jgi:hypothetical protein
MRRAVMIGVLAALLRGPAAQAACVAPAPPTAAERPVKPVLPPKPRCAASGSCMPGEADRYNAEIGAYNAQAKTYRETLQAYVDKLNAYVAAAGAYAKCEVTATNEP